MYMYICRIHFSPNLLGNKGVVNREDMEKMKNGCVLCNMGHSNTEIDVASLRGGNITLQKVKENVHRIIFPDGRKLILLAEGCILNRTASNVPSFVHSITATTQVYCNFLIRHCTSINC